VEDRNIWLKNTVEAIDRFFVDGNIDGLRPFFDIKNNEQANKNAVYLLFGDDFTYALKNKLRTQRRSRNLSTFLDALKLIDLERYAKF
jgi:hypothetical protein